MFPPPVPATHAATRQKVLSVQCHGRYPGTDLSGVPQSLVLQSIRRCTSHFLVHKAMHISYMRPSQHRLDGELMQRHRISPSLTTEPVGERLHMLRHARLYIGLPNRDDACEAAPWLRGLGTQKLDQGYTVTANTRGSERLRGRASYSMPIKVFVPAWLHLSGSVESSTRAAEHKPATGFRSGALSRSHTGVILINGHKTGRCAVLRSRRVINPEE